MAEIIAYFFVIQRFGIAIALLIGIVSLALGLAAFKRTGLIIAATLEAKLGWRQPMIMLHRRFGLATLGALLLVLPGFISNAVGLALLAFHPQAWLYPGAIPRDPDDNVLDLDKGDWRENRPSTSPAREIAHKNHGESGT